MHTRKESNVRDMIFGGLVGIVAAVGNLVWLCALVQMAEPASGFDLSSVLSVVLMIGFGFWLIDVLVAPLNIPLIQWPHLHTATVTAFCGVVSSCVVAAYFAEGEWGTRLLISALVAMGFFTGMVAGLLYNWDDMSKPYPEQQSKNPAF